MHINIQSPGFTPKQDLINLVHAEVEKLSRMCGKMIGSEVCLRLDSSATKENKMCTIRLFIPGNDLLASSQYNKFEQAIAQTIEALKRQIKKHKTKLTGRRDKIIKINKA